MGASIEGENRRQATLAPKHLDNHNLEASMSRRGNCHDNAVAESFFSLLKTKHIKRKIHKTRNEARVVIFNYIEFFYNPNRHHGNNDGLLQKFRAARMNQNSFLLFPRTYLQITPRAC